MVCIHYIHVCIYVTAHESFCFLLDEERYDSVVVGAPLVRASRLELKFSTVIR